VYTRLEPANGNPSQC